ncbi:MAG: hypothetical protein HKO90_07535 [Flavobacteriaceae bacterium]|nr:hypothetical protein [Flavobacteriaceae bacterium]
MNRRYFFFAILAIIILAMIYVFVLNDEQTEAGFSVESSELIMAEDDVQSIAGVIRNNTDQAVDAMELEIKLFDDEGNAIGTLFTKTGEILADSTTAFYLKLVDISPVSEFEVSIVNSKEKSD